MPSEDEIKRYGRADYGPVRTPAASHGQTRTGPDRRGLVAAIVAVVVLLGGAGAAAYILMSGGTSRPASATTTTSASSAAVQLDDYARNACRLLHRAESEWQGDKMTQLSASLDEYNAETAAARSSVAEFAGIARGSAPDSSNTRQIASQLRGWCSAHWSPGR